MVDLCPKVKWSSFKWLISLPCEMWYKNRSSFWLVKNKMVDFTIWKLDTICVWKMTIWTPDSPVFTWWLYKNTIFTELVLQQRSEPRLVQYSKGTKLLGCWLAWTLGWSVFGHLLYIIQTPCKFKALTERFTLVVMLGPTIDLRTIWIVNDNSLVFERFQLTDP
jgi:hypothetical protein